MANEMTPYSETDRAAKKGREFEKLLKSAAEICEDGDPDNGTQYPIFAADLREFRTRVAGMCSNLEQHLAVGSAGAPKEEK